MSSLQSLLQTGTKLYLDTVEPSEVDKSLLWGATGATSNPAIISRIIESGSRDEQIELLLSEGFDDNSIAWQLTDQLVRDAQAKFLPIHQQSAGDAGWVSFELDPILEDPDTLLSDSDRTARYIELGKTWSKGHENRMIKVPATDAGINALETLAACGVTLNVTLIFTVDQYARARDAIWRGAQQRKSLQDFKSVYSVFISRINVYTNREVTDLSSDAQGIVGILNAKRIWHLNQDFWADKDLPLQQELIFASMETKDPKGPAWKYVDAIAGGDIQTNPPELIEVIENSGQNFRRKIHKMANESIQDEINQKVDVPTMYRSLMSEGIDKFIQPQRDLLEQIARKRELLLS
ncbi:Transaldolase [Planctomycetes bacterium CA13]|uniref:Transaldolase n=1 Tax=Novipirellula herctigrandis TaxID=2527986 RepID=A0A5C5ZCH9_9BACT|nr:Transaldolase [Planctomycetes bacterium CA13]